VALVLDLRIKKQVGRVRCAGDNPPDTEKPAAHRNPPGRQEYQKAGYGAFKIGVKMKYCQNAPNPPYGPLFWHECRFALDIEELVGHQAFAVGWVNVFIVYPAV